MRRGAGLRLAEARLLRLRQTDGGGGAKPNRRTSTPTHVWTELKRRCSREKKLNKFAERQKKKKNAEIKL